MVRVAGPLPCGATPAFRPVPMAESLLIVLAAGLAGFVDAITGEGMSLGLISAELGAEVLSAGLRRGRLDVEPVGADAQHGADGRADEGRRVESTDVGAPVVQGQLIGVADNTGQSTGHHLHFQLHG